jgi:Trk-type K+ transport system membrane component
VIRFLILLKLIHYCLRRLVFPKHAVITLKVDGRHVQEDVLMVVGYSVAYLLVSLAFATTLMAIGYEPMDSIFTIMSAMGNAGLAAISGEAWFAMAAFGKTMIILAMLVGRVEIFPALLILMNAAIALRAPSDENDQLSTQSALAAP